MLLKFLSYLHIIDSTLLVISLSIHHLSVLVDKFHLF